MFSVHKEGSITGRCLDRQIRRSELLLTYKRCQANIHVKMRARRLTGFRGCLRNGVAKRLKDQTTRNAPGDANRKNES